MWKKKAFTLIELLVVISVIALLLAILVPALKQAKKHAEKLVCLNNLHSWGISFALYAQAYDGKIVPCESDEGYLWDTQLLKFHGDESVRLCPSASKPLPNPSGWWDLPGTEKHCWRIDYTFTGADDEGKTLVLGSYGMNGWAQYPDGEAFGWEENEYFARQCWGKIDASRFTNEVPLALDCMYREAYPQDDGKPRSTQEETLLYIQVPNEINRFCLDRHRKAVNGVFMDGTARTISLPDLWLLRWAKDFKPKRDIEIYPWMK